MLRVAILCELPRVVVMEGVESASGRALLPTPVLALVDGLRRRGDVAVRVLGFEHGKGAPRRTDGFLFEDVPATVFTLGRGSRLTTLYAVRAAMLRGWIRRNPVDVLHAHGSESGHLWISSLQRRVPVVGTLHGIFGATIDVAARGHCARIAALLQHLSLQRQKLVTTPSAFTTRWVAERYGCAVLTVPNPIEQMWFEKEKSKGSVRHEQGPVLVSVGRILPAKGQADVVRAAARASEIVGPLTLELVGAVQDTKYFRDIAKEAASFPNLTLNYVGLLPLRSRIEHVSRAQVCLHASIGESFGMALAEAHAQGVPVVAYDVGGVSDVVVNGETGFLVPPGDWTKLADALIYLLKDGHRRLQMARDAAERARRWHPDVVAGQFLKCYRKALENR